MNYDVNSKINDCNFYLSKEYYDNKEYEKSYKCYFDLTHNLDKKEVAKYDLSFKDDLILNYVRRIIDSKDNEELQEAIDLLKKIDSTVAKELIVQANDQIQKNRYDNAKKLLTNGDYLDAVHAFEELSGYLDSDEKAIESKYGYVNCYLEKMDESLNAAYIQGDLKTLITATRWKYLDESFDEKLYYQYAKELSELDYLDSAEVYDDLTRWRVGLVINDDENSNISKSTISISETFYGHIEVYGGEYEEQTTLQYRITLPTGEVLSDYFNNVYSGYSGWCCAYYNDWVYGQTGTCSFEILDLNGVVLAQDTVRISY